MAPPRAAAVALCAALCGEVQRALAAVAAGGSTLRGSIPLCRAQPDFETARSRWCGDQTQRYACYKPVGSGIPWDCRQNSPTVCGDGSWPCIWNASEPQLEPQPQPQPPALPQPAPQPTAQPPRDGVGSAVRFLSWNVLYANLGARARDIARGIAMVAPEIASLQETVNFKTNVLDELKSITGQEWAITGAPGCEWYFDGTIFYRSDLWEKLDEGFVPFGGSGCYGGDSRGLNWAALRRRMDGVGVLVFGTHPVCCQGDLPVLEALELIEGEMLARQLQFGLPIVLMGDMNTGYFEPSMALLRDGSADGFGRRWSAPITFRDAYADEHPGDPNPSTIGNAPVRLDYVYFQRSPINLGREVGGQVWSNLPGGSDHRAVSGDVILR